MIVKVSIVTMETKSVGNNLQGLQEERKVRKKNIDIYIVMPLLTIDRAYISVICIITGVNNKIFQEHVSFYITLSQHVAELILKGRNNVISHFKLAPRDDKIYVCSTHEL